MRISYGIRIEQTSLVSQLTYVSLIIGAKQFGEVFMMGCVHLTVNLQMEDLVKKESLLYLNSRELKWIVLNNDQSYYDAFEDEYKYYLDKPGSYSFPNGYVLPKLKGIKSA